MVTTRTDGAGILRAADVTDLLLRPVEDASTAATTATVVTTTSSEFRVPKVTESPSASWVREGEEIGVSGAKFDELVIRPAKIAGLTVISNELADDSSPEAAEQVGQRLALDIAAKLDHAYLSTVTGAEADIAARGLEHQAATVLPTAADFADGLDIFTDAVFEAETHGANITHWLANPADARTLTKLKESDGSNRQLLQPDPTQPGQRVIDGKILLTHNSVTAGRIWGVDQSQILLVIRQDADVTTSDAAYFSKDSLAVRAVMRVGLGFVNEPGIIKIVAGE